MQNIFVSSGFVAVVYFLFKFLEGKFSKAEDIPPFKVLVKDSLLVYFSSIVALYCIDQLSPALKSVSNMQPMVFTDEFPI